MTTHEEFVRKAVYDMDENDRKHLQHLANKLLACYGKNSPFSAVIAFYDGTDSSFSIASVNSDLLLMADILRFGINYCNKAIKEGE